jgi:microcystin-dependent protein
MLKIRQYTALFSRIGTKYGGDGKTTFALPNLIESAGQISRPPVHDG